MKRKANYIAIALFILYLCVAFIFVPLKLGIQPFLIYYLNSIDSMSIILVILSVVQAISCSIIFCEPDENGASLIISSKPLSRMKVLFSKIIVLYINNLILVFIALIFFLVLVAVLGFYDPFTNISGIDTKSYLNVL
jgi:ABC-type transport system involved in multi-copper enzyme maturation permease subunit